MVRELVSLLAWLSVAALFGPVCTRAATEDLDEDWTPVGLRLNQIKWECSEGKLPPEEDERRALKLLDEHRSPEDAGKIYYYIAHAYYGTGLPGPNGPAKLAEYCQKAMQQPMSPERVSRLYEMWAVATSWEARRANPKEFPAARKRAVTGMLRGLQFVLERQTAKVKQSVPVVPGIRYGAPPDSTQAKEIDELVAGAQAHRQRIAAENALVGHHDVLLSAAARLYARKPYATDELAGLAREILQDEQTARELLVKVADEIRINEEQAKAMQGRSPCTSNSAASAEGSEPAPASVAAEGNGSAPCERTGTARPADPGAHTSTSCGAKGQAHGAQESENARLWIPRALLVVGLVVAGGLAALFLCRRRAT